MRRSSFILVFVAFACTTQTYTPYNFLVEQSLEQPFQVLAANSVSTDSGPVNRLDFLHLDESIILKNGYIILVHYSGKFLEFEGDTTVSVKALNASLEQRYHLENNGLRPRIDFLFSSVYSPASIVEDGFNETIHFTNDGPTVFVVDSTDFCLAWTTVKKKDVEYVVTLKDLSDRQIDRFVSSDTIIQFNPLTYNEDLLVAQVSVVDDPFYQSDYLEIKCSGSRQFFSASQCSTTTAIEALEKAYHMERHYYLVNQAGRFFEMAANLSDQPIYAELLADYQFRRGR